MFFTEFTLITNVTSALLLLGAKSFNDILNIFRQRSHGRGFIRNRIALDAVKSRVHTSPIETISKTVLFGKHCQKWNVLKTILTVLSRKHPYLVVLKTLCIRK